MVNKRNKRGNNPQTEAGVNPLLARVCVCMNVCICVSLWFVYVEESVAVHVCVCVCTSDSVRFYVWRSLCLPAHLPVCVIACTPAHFLLVSLYLFVLRSLSLYLSRCLCVSDNRIKWPLKKLCT